ncbi:hypothetical protein MTP99_017737 [Tenebrio molitor]|jgi:Leucine-rich repeat (LRR) protein|nr:hypothetical protein MTP99_017737 [Tenebrio molitor]
MFSLKFVFFILLSTTNVTFVFCVCEKSFVIVCESLSDVEYNTMKKTWTELLIQGDKFDETPPKYILSSKQLNRDLSNLKWLIINKQLVEISKNAFSYCKQLMHLILYDNDIGTLKESTFVRFKNMAKLGLENNNIKEIEKNVFKSSKIESLDLSYNKITVFAAGVFNKCQVKELSLTHNMLWKVEVNSLPTTLKFLRLDHNSFDLAPDELERMSQLEEFTVSHNKIKSIPDLSRLPMLKKLDFSFNQISSVNQQFDNLTHLRHLDLSGNKLWRLAFTPKFIKHSRHQMKILLAFNRLRNLDLRYFNNTDLTITLSGNPWNCKCWDNMLKIINRRHSTITQTICDRRILRLGKNPCCLVDTSNQCSENKISDLALERFLSAYQSDNCDIFTDINTFIN